TSTKECRLKVLWSSSEGLPFFLTTGETREGWWKEKSDVSRSTERREDAAALSFRLPFLFSEFNSHVFSVGLRSVFRRCGPFPSESKPTGLRFGEDRGEVPSSAAVFVEL
ncbi:hypothetical protein GBAR_LOCUS16697, partial [Geodia barretti]